MLLSWPWNRKKYAFLPGTFTIVSDVKEESHLEEKKGKRESGEKIERA